MELVKAEEEAETSTRPRALQREESGPLRPRVNRPRV